MKTALVCDLYCSRMANIESWPFVFGAQGMSDARPEVLPPTSILLMVSIGLMVLALVLWSLRARWFSILLRDRLAMNVCMAFAGSIFIITLLTHYFETAENQNFTNFYESFWSITVFIFSGLEDRGPQTPGGRFSATLGLLLGPLFFAFITGWLAKILIFSEKRMPQHLRDHYLILNWNSRAIDIARQLHHPLIKAREGNVVIVVLTDDESLSVKQLKEAGTGSDKVFEDFYLCVGDPTKEHALRNANAHDARTVLILADERADSHADENTIRSVVMLRRLARQQRLDSMHVVAELINPDNVEVLNEVGKNFPGLLEQISGLQIRTCLMAQAALNPGAIDFYSDLLQVTSDTNEVYVRPIPESVVGTSFRDFGALILSVSTSQPMIAVGVQRRTSGRARIFCNPRDGEPGAVLGPNDQMVLLAYEPPPQDVLLQLASGADHG